MKCDPSVLVLGVSEPETAANDSYGTDLVENKITVT